VLFIDNSIIIFNGKYKIKIDQLDKYSSISITYKKILDVVDKLIELTLGIVWACMFSDAWDYREITWEVNDYR